MDLLSTLKSLITGIDEGLLIFDHTGKILHSSIDVVEQFSDKVGEGGNILSILGPKNEEFNHFLSDIHITKYRDFRLNTFVNGKNKPARMRAAVWKTNDEDSIVLASIVDAKFIERKRRDVLRKTLVIEELSKSMKIRTGKLYDSILEILKSSAQAVQTTRVNAWMFNDDETLLQCIGNFDSKVFSLVSQESLPRIDIPNYITAFKSTKIILAPDARNHPLTKELNESYFYPNNIYSLMDIPLRMDGKIVGVLCFEEVDEIRHWTLQDQKFGLIAAQMIALAFETHRRKISQQELEIFAFNQKKLLVETNHRIANNLAVVLRIMRMQVDRCKDQFHKKLFLESVNRIESIQFLHSTLTDSNSENRVKIDKYAQQLVKSVSETYADSEYSIQLIENYTPLEISNKKALYLGIILNEALTNAYKHAFRTSKAGMIRVEFYTETIFGILEVFDSGEGSSLKEFVKGLGYEIMNSMADELGAELKIDTKSGTMVRLKFRLS
ncbi:MAG: histidine kinase dimerization/phosphoacceptor domain -containing protein [Fluviicola sp.]|jgi:two-component sensor histidine kinase